MLCRFSKKMNTALLIIIFLYPCLGAHAYDLSEDDKKLLSNIAQNFHPAFNVIRTHPNSHQFAVITFNGAGSNLSSLQPCPLQFNQGVCGNYLAATVIKIKQDIKVHAEKRLIYDAINWIHSNGIPSTIHLYTYYSPCVECSLDIYILAQKFPNTTIYVGYSEQYRKAYSKAKDILADLENVYMGQINYPDAEYDGPHGSANSAGLSSQPSELEILKKELKDIIQEINSVIESSDDKDYLEVEKSYLRNVATKITRDIAPNSDSHITQAQRKKRKRNQSSSPYEKESYKRQEITNASVQVFVQDNVKSAPMERLAMHTMYVLFCLAILFVLFV